MDFVGRGRELAYLEKTWGDDESAFIPVYGRRRVGKSELLLQFLDGRDGVYFLGKQTPAKHQIAEFLSQAADLLDEPLLTEVDVSDWKRALTLVIDRWPADRKLALVFDEFQWTVAASPELPSVLQELWDRRLRDDGRFVVIVCGSYVGFMEREILGRKSPLFGRRTGLIHLQPFDFREAREFHPNYSVRNSARTFFVCGGVPAYLRAFAPNKSVEANIREEILDEYGPLYAEPEFLLREELREVENYHAVLMVLAEGSAPPADIARQTGLPDRSVHYYLDQLVQLTYVHKRTPLCDTPPKRRVRYELSDPLLRFWFRFVYPNLGELRQVGPAKMFDRRIRPQLASWFGLAFEDLCRQALGCVYEETGVEATYDIGEYWDKNVQVDVVGLRGDAWTDLGECKWGRVGSAKTLARELRAKAKSFPNDRNATLGLHAFVKSVPAGADDTIEWHGLEDLYGV